MGLAIRKGDKVKVLAGRDKGKTGKVVHVYPKKGRALVEVSGGITLERMNRIVKQHGLGFGPDRGLGQPHSARSLSWSSARRSRELTVPRGSSSSSAISPGVYSRR